MPDTGVCTNLGAAAHYVAERLNVDPRPINLADRRLQIPSQSFGTQELDRAIAVESVAHPTPTVDTVIDVLRAATGCPPSNCRTCLAKDFAGGICCPKRTDYFE